MIAVVLMLSSIGLVSTLAGSVAAFFVEHQDEPDEADVRQRLERIESMVVRLLEERDNERVSRT